jgi:hypothetical protein
MRNPEDSEKDELRSKLAHSSPSVPPEIREKLEQELPRITEESWREEERSASGALRYSRTDYACQNFARKIKEVLASLPKETKE